MDKNQNSKLLPKYHDDPYDDGEEEVHHTMPVRKVAGTTKDNMCYSIFVTICCCAPVGIVAIVMSVMSRDAVSHGEHERAHARGRDARKFSNISLGLGLLAWVVIITIVGLWSAYFVLFLAPRQQASMNEMAQFGKSLDQQLHDKLAQNAHSLQGPPSEQGNLPPVSEEIATAEKQPHQLRIPVAQPPVAADKEPKHPPAATIKEPKHPPAATIKEPKQPPAATIKEPKQPPVAAGKEPHQPPVEEDTASGEMNTRKENTLDTLKDDTQLDNHGMGKNDQKIPQPNDSAKDVDGNTRK